MRRASFLLLSGISISLLQATEIAWTGGGDGTSWSDAANWSPSVCPGADDVALFTNGVGEATINLPEAVTLKQMKFDLGRWRFTGAELVLTAQEPFPWESVGPKPRELSVFENPVRFAYTGDKRVYGGKIYRNKVVCDGTGRIFFARQYNGARDDTGSVVGQVALLGESCQLDLSGVASVSFGANKSKAEDGVEAVIGEGASLTAKAFYNFPGSRTELTNATLRLTATGTAFTQTRDSVFSIRKGGRLEAAGLLDLGQNNSTRPEPSFFVVDRGMVKAGSVTLSGLDFTATVENGGTVQADGDVSLTRGTLRVTDGRVIAGRRLNLSAEARLTLDPVRASIGGVQAPVFAAGAKIALDPIYADKTSGRFLLTSWDEGEISADLETLFDTASARGRAPRLSVETEQGRGYLWLDLDRNATYPTVRAMAVGDSITEGKHPLVDSRGPYGNWRMTCWKALAAAGYDVVAVGWRDLYPEDHAGRTMPLRWRGHCGISGQYLRTADGRAGHLESIGAELDQAGDVDLVLMMIGTNDIERNAKAGELLAAWRKLVNRIIATRPSVRIVCGTVVDRTDIVSAKNRRQTIRDFNSGIRELIATPGVFPTGQVSISENYDAVPLDLFYNTLHPDWPGMIRLGCAFGEAATSALAAPGPAAEPWRATVTRGSAANVPAAYRRGFRLAQTIRPTPTTHYTDGSVQYEEGDPKAARREIGRVAYYLELRRRNTPTTDYHGHVRWLWADMDAFGDRTLEAVGLPVSSDTRQQRVRRLHVVSNEPLIASIPPEDNTQAGWIQFSPHNCSGDPSGLADAPADFYHYDWNDTFGTGFYGAFQLARLLPGESPEATMLFAYNRWARRNDTGPTEIVLGDFAQRISSTTSNWSLNGVLTYMFDTMSAEAYDEIIVEIHTKPAKEGLVLALQ